MTSSLVRVERRAGQRFSFALPVSLRDLDSGLESLGFTLDVSSRGLFLFTDGAMLEGAEIELMFSMPSEITLGESMTVRARGRVLRVTRPENSSGPQQPAQDAAHNKIGVAVRLLSYEYLPDAPAASAAFYRISELHRHAGDVHTTTLAR
jgi:PilZ domain